MEKQNRYRETDRQVKRVREIYSRIGQPLPADIIVDLYLHLGAIREAVLENGCSEMRKKSKRKLDA